MCEVSLDIRKGDLFNSFDEIETKMSAKCQENFVQFYKKEAKTVGSVAKTIKRYINPGLIYYHVTWACVFGGRTFQSRGHGIRKSRTLRKEDICRAQISIRISDCGNKFEVIKAENTHNHVVNENLYKQLPQQRQLPKEIKENAKKLLHLKVNKQLLKEELENKLQKTVTLKDLTNLQCEERRGYTNDIRTACETVQRKFGADCHLLIDRNDMFRGLMFCTNSMRKSFEAYPEFLCVDATYKLLNIRAPVYLMLNEDGNGESIVVCIAILIQEDADSLEWLFENFKILNPSWNKIKTFMTDKDLTERDTILKCFPGVTLQLCIFHVLKIFNSEITCEKFNITASEKNIILDFLQKLVYCKTNDDFVKIINTMEKSISDKVFKYLSENWIGIKEQWCPYLAQIPSNFLNTTNNRLECINSKLKKVILKNSSLEEFLDKLFSILRCLKEEQNFRLADHINKRNVGNTYSETQSKFKNLLSPYAFDKMRSQFDYTSVNIIEVDGMFYCSSKNSKDVKYTTKPDFCDCYFYISMQLPCKHIFAVRHHLNQDAFDARVVAERWKIEYVIKNSSLFTNSDITEVSPGSYENIVDVVSNKQKRVLSQQEKFRILFVKCKLLASLGAEAQSKDFTNVCHLFDSIITKFQQNKYNIDIATDTEQYLDVDMEAANINQNNIPNVNNLMDGSNLSNIQNIHNGNTTENEQNSQCNIVQNMKTTNTENMDYTDDITVNEEICNMSENIVQDINIINVEKFNERGVIMNDDVYVNAFENDHNYSQSEIPQTFKLSNDVNLSDIKVFPAKCRGRPKGHDKTVIGLKRKKFEKNMLFEKKQKSEKKNIILSWILRDPQNVKNLIRSLDEIKFLEDIDVRLLEVNINLIRNQFTPEIWPAFRDIKNRLAANAKWTCPICSEEISVSQPTVRCESCLHWLHINSCTSGFSKTEKYICNKCL